MLFAKGMYSEKGLQVLIQVFHTAAIVKIDREDMNRDKVLAHVLGVRTDSI